MKIILLFLLFTANIVAQESYLVTKVFDGDTFQIETGEKVRLIGIDEIVSSMPNFK